MAITCCSDPDRWAAWIHTKSAKEVGIKIIVRIGNINQSGITGFLSDD